MLATLKPDVVVLDLRMPGMDGYEVCRLIKSQDATRHAEVVAMTAYPSPESQQQVIECGARVCIGKPLDMAQLINEVEISL
jgi:CheY-like chemotaxis protein